MMTSLWRHWNDDYSNENFTHMALFRLLTPVSGLQIDYYSYDSASFNTHTHSNHILMYWLHPIISPYIPHIIQPGIHKSQQNPTI